MSLRIAAFLSCLLLAGTAAAEDSILGDSMRIGGSVHLQEATAGNFDAIGGSVRIDAGVAGNLRAAGGSIKVGVGAAIEGDASLAGGNITVRGPIHGDLHAAGGNITIDAPITGDAYVAGGSLTLGPEARIDGKVKFRGGEMHVDPAAVVTGGTNSNPGRSHRPEASEHSPVTHAVFWTIGLAALAALLAAAFPGSSQHMAQELRERPWHTSLLGLLVLTAVPLAALLLMVTLIGIPLGLLAILLYAALLFVGYVWIAVVVGGLLLDRFNAETAALVAWRVGAAVLAMVVLAILVRVPFLGGIVKFVALLAGVGMITAAVLRRVNVPAREQLPSP
ncbi:MAG: polymer-forming cytoskeletal protein [Usitatibacter sp.]